MQRKRSLAQLANEKVMQAEAKRRAFKTALRAAEHKIDVQIRLRRRAILEGLRWNEVTPGTRGPCASCKYESCRLWVGYWQEYKIKPMVPPYSIVCTQPLCAFCAARRQAAERGKPNWRPEPR